MLGTVKARVTKKMNDELGQLFTIAEIEEALSQMSPLKSHGLDGFGAGSY